MTKQERFHKIMIKGLEGLGAEFIDNMPGPRYGLMTPAGQLTITLGSITQSLIVFTRFEEPHRAVEHNVVGCNPHSGKWNFHYGYRGQDPKEAADYALRVISRVAGKAPELHKIMTEIAKDLGFPTLMTRGRDRLDFVPVSARGMEEALLKAYHKGACDAQS